MIFSQTKKYAITEQASDYLYCAPGTRPPIGCVQSPGATKHIVLESGAKPTPFQGYVPRTLMYEDCLHTCEEIMHGKLFVPPKGDEEGVVRSSLKKPVMVGTEIVTDFAYSVEMNRAIAAAKLADEDHKSNAVRPDVGEGFAIVASKKNDTGEERYPYHAAAVVARDGETAVTLEMFATNQDAEKRDQHATFRMYGTTKTLVEHIGSRRSGTKIVELQSQKWFHAKWMDHFNGLDPVTLVITKKVGASDTSSSIATGETSSELSSSELSSSDSC